MITVKPLSHVSVCVCVCVYVCVCTLLVDVSVWLVTVDDLQDVLIG